MSVATATAIAIGTAAATAGTGVVTAKMASNSAKNAAKTQSDAAERAMAIQTQQYQQARQDFAPYQQQGVNAMNAMGQMAGRPPINFDPNQRMGIPGVPGAMSERDMMSRGAVSERDMALMGQLGMSRPTLMQQGGVQGVPGAISERDMMSRGAMSEQDMVLLRAPNGQTQSVPASIAPQMIARGAVRVG